MDALIPVMLGGASGSYHVLKTEGHAHFNSRASITAPSDAVLAIITYSISSSGVGELMSQYIIWLYRGGTALIISGNKGHIGMITWNTGNNTIESTTSEEVGVSVVMLGE